MASAGCRKIDEVPVEASVAGDLLGDEARLAHACSDDAALEPEDQVQGIQEGLAEVFCDLANRNSFALDDLASTFDPGVH